MATYKTVDNQTTLDICVTIYNSLDYLAKLMFDNNLNIDTQIAAGTSITYDVIFTPNLNKITTGADLY
jgi:hypothetical protein